MHNTTLMQGLPARMIFLSGVLVLCGLKAQAAEVTGLIADEVVRCHATGSKLVRKLCFQAKVGYKLDILAGEPVRNFSLNWLPVSVVLASPRGGQDSPLYLRDLPAPVQAAIQRMNLQLTGLLRLDLPEHHSYLTTSATVYTDFDTGVSTPPQKTSWNVPGSPAWEKLFKRAIFPSCTSQAYMSNEPAKQAQAMLRQGGFKSVTVQCLGQVTMTDVDRVERAIHEYCEAQRSSREAQGSALCVADKAPKTEELPKPPTPTPVKREESAKPLPASPSKPSPVVPERTPAQPSVADRSVGGRSLADILDESAEKDQVAARLSEARAKYRDQALSQCASRLREVDTCYAQAGCQKPATTLTADECRRLPPYPSDGGGLVLYSCSRGDDCESPQARQRRREREQERSDKLERERSDWSSRYGEQSRLCQQARDQRPAYEQCVQRNAARCNPSGETSASACADRQLNQNGPDERSVRAQLEKEWAKGKSR